MTPAEHERFEDLARKAINGRASAEERAELELLLNREPALKEEFKQCQTDAKLAGEILPLLDASQAVGQRLPQQARRRLQSKVHETLAAGQAELGRLERVFERLVEWAHSASDARDRRERLHLVGELPLRLLRRIGREAEPEALGCPEPSAKYFALEDAPGPQRAREAEALLGKLHQVQQQTNGLLERYTEQFQRLERELSAARQTFEKVSAELQAMHRQLETELSEMRAQNQSLETALLDLFRNPR